MAKQVFNKRATSNGRINARMAGGRSGLIRKVYRKAEGTITVFLSLILLLILSLLCTIIEGARVNTARVFAERTLNTAMDSVLAQYYGPLWEEYHIFGYYAGDGKDTDQKNTIAEALSEYMSYTFAPSRASEAQLPVGGIELYGISPENISIDTETDLADYEGKLLINEAVEYMKYREIGNGIEALLDKLKLLETPDKVSYIMEEKQKAEEELVEIDKEILRLMELFDGLQTSGKGIKLAKDGSLKMDSVFIKKICYNEVTMESVGINQENIFQTQKGNYVNPSIYFTGIEKNFTAIGQVVSTIEAYQEDINAAAAALTQLQSELAERKAVKDKSKEDKKQIVSLRKGILGYKSLIEERKDWISEQRKAIEPLVSSIRTSSQTLSGLLEEITGLTGEAIAALDRIILKAELAAPLIRQYEDLLTSQKDILTEDIYQGLEEELKELKRYIATDENGYDFSGMKIILENNRKILTDTLSALNDAQQKLSAKDYQASEAAFEYAEGTLQAYQIQGLTIDYSTLVIDKSGLKAPLDEVNNLLQGGLLSLVLDPGSLSDAELKTSGLLPSEAYAMTQEKEDFITKITSFFEEAIIGGKNSGMGGLFASFGDSAGMGAALKKSINNLAEILLYQEYIREHFGSYQPSGIDNGEQKPAVLRYEQEYFLAGKNTDQENLASVVSRIIFIRMIFDFVSVLSDSTIRNEAKVVAASLVGFTGLPILVSLTQVLILLIWSFTEALLDTCALMMGKSIPILKQRITLTFPEIFLINREFLQKKASSLADTKELSFSYQEYLWIFLLMKNKEELAYRSMDLMQENIKLRYAADTFQLEDCLYGFEVSADFQIKSQFTAFTFLKKYIKNNGNAFHYSVKASYSY